MIEVSTQQILQNAVSVKKIMASLSKEQKNDALKSMAKSLIDNAEQILKANSQDIERSKGVISNVMIDRLKLDESRIQGMAKGILDVAKLDDPINSVISKTTQKDGLIIEKTCVPLGVVAIIYESRPNVTSDAAALCLKSSNVCVLRVGKEAYLSAKAIVDAMRLGLQKCSIPVEAISLIEDTTRNSAHELMTATNYVDLLIPRGGAGLIKACVDNAKVPCIQTGTGICHVYVDKDADFEKALKIIYNAKTSRPSVCNAAEVCLVHRDIAEEFLPKLRKQKACR